MSSFRRENVRYLRPLWLRVLIAYAIIVAAIVGAMLLPTSSLGSMPLVVGLTAGVAVVVYRRLQNRKRSDLARQQTSADAAARYLYGAYLSLPNPAVVPVVACGTAQLHVLYGNFERAEDVLRAVDWDKQPPFLRGDQLFVRAMMAHVKGDHAAGLAVAETLPELMDIPRVAPGSRRLRRSLAMLIDIGRVLARDDRDAAKRLADPKVTKVLKLQRGVVDWALAQGHARWGEGGEAARWLASSRTLLPHAYGLGVARPPERPVQPGVLDPSNPYAAPVTSSGDAPFEIKQQGGYWRRRIAWTVGLWVAATALTYIYFLYVGS